MAPPRAPSPGALGPGALPPDERLRLLKEETERRRKKLEQMERAKKEAEELKAKEALERRRLQRIAEDERMRKPWQQPEPPKKAILRAGQKKPITSPSPRDASPGLDQKRQEAERQRKEWRDGLKAHIEQQRVAQHTPPAASPAGGEALTWAELKLAAEAGFDELLRQQQMQQQMESMDPRAARAAARNRSPFKSPLRGTPGPEAVQVTLLPSTPPAAQYFMDHTLHPQQPSAWHNTRPAVAEAEAQPANLSPPPAEQPSHASTGTTFDAPVMRGADNPLLNALPAHMTATASTSMGAATTDTTASAGARTSQPSVHAVGAAGDSSNSTGLRRGATTAPRYRPGPQDADDLDGPLMASVEVDGFNGLSGAEPGAAATGPTTLQPVLDAASSPSQDVVRMSSPSVATGSQVTFTGPPGSSGNQAGGSVTQGSVTMAHMGTQAGRGSASGTPTSAPQPLGAAGHDALSAEQRRAIVADLFAPAASASPQQVAAAGLGGSGRLQPPSHLQLQLGNMPAAAAGVGSPGLTQSPGAGSGGPHSARRRHADVTTTPASPSSPAARRALKLDAAVDAAPAASGGIPGQASVAAGGEGVEQPWPSSSAVQKPVPVQAPAPPPRSLLSWGAPGAAPAQPQQRPQQHTRSTWQTPAAAPLQPAVPQASQAAGTSTSSFDFDGSSAHGAGSTPGLSFADHATEVGSSHQHRSGLSASQAGLGASSRVAADDGPAHADPGYITLGSSITAMPAPPADSQLQLLPQPEASQQQAAQHHQPVDQNHAIDLDAQAAEAEPSAPTHEALASDCVEQQQMTLLPPRVEPEADTAQAPAVDAAQGEVGGLLAEIQQLSALRRALKAEFEALGHGGAVEGLQSLTAVLSGQPEEAGAGRGMPAEGTQEQHIVAAAPLPLPENPQAHQSGSQIQPQATMSEPQPQLAVAHPQTVPMQPPQPQTQAAAMPAPTPAAPAPLLSWGPRTAQRTNYPAAPTSGAAAASARPAAAIAAARTASNVARQDSSSMQMLPLADAAGMPVLRAHVNPLFNDADMLESVDTSIARRNPATHLTAGKRAQDGTGAASSNQGQQPMQPSVVPTPSAPQGAAVSKQSQPQPQQQRQQQLPTPTQQQQLVANDGVHAAAAQPAQTSPAPATAMKNLPPAHLMKLLYEQAGMTPPASLQPEPEPTPQPAVQPPAQQVALPLPAQLQAIQQAAPSCGAPAPAADLGHHAGAGAGQSVPIEVHPLAASLPPDAAAPPAPMPMPAPAPLPVPLHMPQPAPHNAPSHQAEDPWAAAAAQAAAAAYVPLNTVPVLAAAAPPTQPALLQPAPNNTALPLQQVPLQQAPSQQAGTPVVMAPQQEVVGITAGPAAALPAPLQWTIPTGQPQVQGAGQPAVPPSLARPSKPRAPATQPSSTAAGAASPGPKGGLAWGYSAPKQQSKAGVSPGPGKQVPAPLPVERPLVMDGSYMEAARVARERAERERADREAIAMQVAAQRAAAAAQATAQQRAAPVEGPSVAAAPAPMPSLRPFPSPMPTPTARLPPPAPPLKAPANIGSYAQPPPSISVLAAQRAAKAAALTAMAAAGNIGTGTTPSSAPVSGVATPAASGGAFARGAPLSAPVTPGTRAAPSSAPSARAAPGQAWGETPTSGAGSGRPSRIPSAPTARTPGGASAISSRPISGVPNSIEDVVGDGDDGDEGVGDENGMYAFLERACDEEGPEKAGAAAPMPQKQAPLLPTLGGSRKLQDLRPQELQLPASGMSTPSVASYQQHHQLPAVTATTAAQPQSGRSTQQQQSQQPQQQRATPATKLGRVQGTPPKQRPTPAASTTGSTPARSAAGSTPATPFTAAIRELMGLPGAAPLQAAQAAAAAAAGAGGGKFVGRLLDARGQPTRLSTEEAALLESLQKIDHTILARGLADAGLVRQDAAGPAGPQAGAGGGRARKGAGKTAPLQASVQAAQLRDSIEKLDARLWELRARMQDRAVAVGAPGAVASARPAGRQARAPLAPAQAAAAAANTSPAKRTPAAAAKAKTPTPNKAKALRDARQAELVAAAAGGHSSGSVGAVGAPSAAGMSPGGDGYGYGHAGSAPNPSPPALPRGSSAMAAAQNGPGAGAGLMPPRPPVPTRLPSAPQMGGLQQQQPPLYQPPGMYGEAGVLPPHGVPQQPQAQGQYPGQMAGQYGMQQMHASNMQAGAFPAALQPQLYMQPQAGMQQLQPQQQVQRVQVSPMSPMQAVPQLLALQPGLAYVPAILPNGQVAYVPQQVSSRNGPEAAATMYETQQPPASMQAAMQQPMQQQVVGQQPLMAWGEAPQQQALQQVQQQQPGPSLYTFRQGDRGLLDSLQPSHHLNQNHNQQQQQNHHPLHQQQLHYQASVMRQRTPSHSGSSTDGNTLTFAPYRPLQAVPTAMQTMFLPQQGTAHAHVPQQPVGQEMPQQVQHTHGAGQVMLTQQPQYVAMPQLAQMHPAPQMQQAQLQAPQMQQAQVQAASQGYVQHSPGSQQHWGLPTQPGPQQPVAQAQQQPPPAVSAAPNVQGGASRAGDGVIRAFNLDVLLH